MKPSRQPFKLRDQPLIPEEIETAAADWIARRDQGFDPGEAAAFEAWTLADPRHAAAVAELEEAWVAINRPRLAGRGREVMAEIGTLTGQRWQRRRRRAFGAASTLLAAAAAIAIGFFFLPFRSDAPERAPRTVTLRPDRQVLPDGSSIELNSGAEIAVEFSPEKRTVRLLRGEALFSVAKDAARPFVVNVSAVEVRAVGTAFAVRYGPGKVDVLVTEGRVAVQRASDGRSLIGDRPSVAASDFSAVSADAPLLAAGHRVAIPVVDLPAPSLAVASVSMGEIAGALAWRQRRVEFTSTPLAEAVPLFNRGNQTRLTLADHATGEMKISGVFWTDDPEGFARLLESSLGVKAIRGSDGAIVLRK